MGACPPLQAADLNTLLKGVEQRYNRAKTLEVHFVESYTVQGRARKSESGELTLRKPGRMRWDYTGPSGKLFVSDGKDVYLYTPEAHRVEKTKLKASEDMRAPLAFLLGKLDFAKEFRDFDVKPEGANYLITAKAKSDKFPYEQVQMLVTPDYRDPAPGHQHAGHVAAHVPVGRREAESTGQRCRVQVPDARRGRLWWTPEGSD